MKSVYSRYVLRFSRISQKSAVLIVRYSQKKKLISIIFYCSENLSIAHSVGTRTTVQVGVSANCNSPNEHFNQNRKLKMSPVQVPTSLEELLHWFCKRPSSFNSPFLQFMPIWSGLDLDYTFLWSILYQQILQLWVHISSHGSSLIQFISDHSISCKWASLQIG